MIHYGDTNTHFIYGRTVNDHHHHPQSRKYKTTKLSLTTLLLYSTLTLFLTIFHNSSGIIIGICVVEWLEKFQIQKLVFKYLWNFWSLFESSTNNFDGLIFVCSSTQMSTMFPLFHLIIPTDF